MRTGIDRGVPKGVKKNRVKGPPAVYAGGRVCLALYRVLVSEFLPSFIVLSQFYKYIWLGERG